MTFTIIFKDETLYRDATLDDERITIHPYWQVAQIFGAMEFLTKDLAAVSCQTIAGFKVIRN